MIERAFCFGEHRHLVGVLTEPTGLSVPTRTAAILVNAGLVHRVGPQRLHVKLARRIAELGLLAFRFDLSGIGDSVSQPNDQTFVERSSDEIKQAMHLLEEQFGTTRFIPMGICSGADLAAHMALHDPRVVGMVGINGSYVDSETEEALLREANARIQRRYYRRHLFKLSSWQRAFTGRSSFRNIFKTARTWCRPRERNSSIPASTASRPLSFLRELTAQPVDSLLIYSDGSTAFDIFELALNDPEVRGTAADRLQITVVRDCDHIFTRLENQLTLIDTVNQWLIARHPKCSHYSDPSQNLARSWTGKPQSSCQVCHEDTNACMSVEGEYK